MVGLTREQRAQRQAEAKQSEDFGGASYVGLQDQVDAVNEIDERAPDRRPATIVDLQTQETAPDNRQFAGDMGKALNQMAGRAAITENTDPHPGITAAENPPTVPNLNGLSAGEGEEIRLLRGYQPDDGQGSGQGIKRQAGEVMRVPSKEAKRLVNMGAAKFTDA